MAPTTSAGIGPRSCSDLSPPTVEVSPFAVFSACPHCDGDMAPEHAHYRCTGCGWRDSCCD